MLAVPALPAGDERRDDDPITLLYLRDLPPDVYDFAHKFVAEDIAGPHGWDEAIDQVQVRPARRREPNFQDYVVRVQDLGVGNGLDAKIVDAIPAKCAHMVLP